jgi:predicted helicase
MKKTAPIYYFSLTDEMLREDKLHWFANTKFEEIPFERIEPDKNHNWLNLADNDFDDLLPLANKETKLAKSPTEERAVFKLFSNGVNTARDEWVYDDCKTHLQNKIHFFIEIYNDLVEKAVSVEDLDLSIKWSNSLKNKLASREKFKYRNELVVNLSYRPYTTKCYYSEKAMSDRLTSNHYELFTNDLVATNQLITFTGLSSSKPFSVLATAKIFSFDFIEKTQCLPLYRYDSKGNRHDNITDWGLKQFRTHYQDDTITKENLFHYTYAVLHHPSYREKYALNLKREFPRLPFYEDFPKWVKWGNQLMDLHLNYEQVKKYPLKQIDIDTKKPNKPKLKADKKAGKIQLDEITTLQGIPAKAWDYKLGNRSALEWILDQYKEKKPRDKTIAEKFNTYRFADYKTSVIELLQRVCTVSVETMKIIEEMP